MAPPDLYTIRNADNTGEEKLQLGEIISRCEHIALHDGTRYFVGRETIRGRLRCGVRTWEGLTAKTATAKGRVKNHKWRGRQG